MASPKFAEPTWSASWGIAAPESSIE
jgi:hypothetical protein